MLMREEKKASESKVLMLLKGNLVKEWVQEDDKLGFGGWLFVVAFFMSRDDREYELIINKIII